MTDQLPEPGLRFFRYFPSAPAPRRADQSAAGTLPTRAYRYCEAVRLAGGWGYWLFAPLSFSVLWDGSEILWRPVGSDEGWEPLQDSIPFPGFPQAWDAASPDAFQGLCPPFLTALPEPGLLQITLGVIPTTNPGWLLYTRPVPNFSGAAHAEGFVGLVDSEAYRFGPLFTNVRLCVTGQPITFLADRPLVQLSVVPRWLLAESLLPDIPGVADMEAWGEAEWAGYQQTIVAPNSRPQRRYGEYAVRARKLAQGALCPVTRRAAETAAAVSG